MAEEKEKSRADASIEAVTRMFREHGWSEPIPCEGHGSITIIRPNNQDKK